MVSGHRRFVRTLLLAALGLSAVTCVGTGTPGDDPARTSQALGSNCAPTEPDAPRMLRQLSLDLRGAPPTYEEIEAVSRAGRVTPEAIDGMLRSPQFLDQVGRWHADILWPNLDGFLLRVGGLRMSRGGTNPELALEVLDRRTDEATCPASGDASLTASVCCTASNPTHPACCMVRNRTFNANDPACVEKVKRLGAAYTVGFGAGDRQLRGGQGSTGCDDALEYPPPRVPTTSTTWLHDANGRPYYVSPRSGQRRYFYDDDDVPLPYDDWTHCPNYCRAATGTGANGAFVANDFVAKRRADGSSGDGPGARCPDGYTEVLNPCDNVSYDGAERVVRLRREGYRLTSQYWTGGRLLKVCAYEAQTRTNSVYTGQLCQPSLRVEPSCGCGPNGVYCAPSTGDRSVVPTRAERRMREALNDEPLEIVKSVIGRDEDYYAAYTTRRSFITGPLAFMYRNQSDRLNGLTVSPPAPDAMIPQLPYDDEGWHEYVRGAEHAGVLTTAAFLGRFPTWRSRITKFRTSLMCRPFEPPSGAPPSPEDVCNREPNLAHRCGCQHCHASIEPLGAYWGRWAERAAVYLHPTTFPSFDPNCAQCANTGAFCTPRCRTNYVTSTLDADGARYAGTLFGALYRLPEEMNRLEQGPAALVANALATGEMQACTVNTTWQRLVGRPMNAQETRDVLPTLLQQFEQSRHNYRQLVRAIVTAPAYRRID